MNGRQYGAAVVILLAAALLRLTGLGDMPFWCDEAYTALTATAPDPMASLLAIEHSPPLYYNFLMTFWAWLGASEGWFRMPSVAASLGILLLAARMGRLIAGHRAALWAMVLCGASAYLVTHAREARSYMLAGFFSFWAMVEAVEIVRSSSRSAWVRFGIAALAACYTHYVQVVVASACAATILILRPERRSWKGLGLVLAGGLAAFVPWFSFLRTQIFRDTFYAGVWRGDAFSALAPLDGLYYIQRLFAWILLYNVPPDAYRALYLPVPFLAVVAALSLLSGRLRRGAHAVSALTLLAVLAALAGVLWTIRAVGEPAYLLAFFPLALTIVAAGIAEGLRRGRVRAILAALLGAGILVAAAAGIFETWSNRFHLEDRLTRDPWSRLAARLKERAGDGDGIVVVPGWPSPGAWYFRMAGTVPFHQVWLSTPYFRRTAPHAGLTLAEGAEGAERLAGELSRRYSRIFLCRFRPGHYPFEDRFFPALAQDRILDRTEIFGRITLEEYARPAPRSDTTVRLGSPEGISGDSGMPAQVRPAG